jgi:drug/metabolite transporter, DME family
MSTPARARLQLVGAAALFSTGGAAIKACELDAWQVASLRSGVAALAFLLFVPAVRRLPSAREWLVGSAYAATMVLFVLANKLTTSANSIFLQSTAPLYILLLSPWLLRERIGRREMLFLLTMAAGLACFFVDETRVQESAPDPWLGNVLALASGVCWAATVVGLRWLAQRGEGSSSLGAMLPGNLLAFVGCLPLAWPLADVRPLDWAVVGYLGVFQIGLAYLLVTRGLARVPAFEASVLLLVEPVLNPIWAWILHGERPGPWALLGGVLIVAATAGKTWLDARAPLPAAPPTS